MLDPLGTSPADPSAGSITPDIGGSIAAVSDNKSLADARRLLRAAIEQCLDGRPLRTREVMRAMRAHGGPGPGG